MEYSLKDIVQYASAGDALKTSDAFASLVGDRIASSIEARKVELAQQIFNSNSEETDEEETEEDEDQDYSEEDEETDENA